MEKSKNPSWIKEMHNMVEEKKGLMTEADGQQVREMMKIPNEDVSIEDVIFKNYQNYF
jgi:hypothetical protein